MGAWGFKSYENDAAFDALGVGFDRVHGPVYDELMDDRNPLTVDQIHQRLANAATLAAAIDSLREEFETDLDAWDDEEARLAFAGVVVRHAELGVSIPDDLRERAVGWLEGEDIEWHEATQRRLRRQAELELLRRTAPPPRPAEAAGP
jgi:hypothetical protein